MAPQDLSALALAIEKMRGETNEKLARIEGKQEALVAADQAAQKAADHRHANAMQAISAFVPRGEIEKDNAARDARPTALEARLDGRVSILEKRIWGALIGVAAALAGAVLSALNIHLKL